MTIVGVNVRGTLTLPDLCVMDVRKSISLRNVLTRFVTMMGDRVSLFVGVRFLEINFGKI